MSDRMYSNSKPGEFISISQNMNSPPSVYGNVQDIEMDIKREPEEFFKVETE